jgi:hypothetical protein
MQALVALALLLCALLAQLLGSPPRPAQTAASAEPDLSGPRLGWRKRRERRVCAGAARGGPDPGFAAHPRLSHRLPSTFDSCAAGQSVPLVSGIHLLVILPPSAAPEVSPGVSWVGREAHSSRSRTSLRPHADRSLVVCLCAAVAQRRSSVHSTGQRVTPDSGEWAWAGRCSHTTRSGGVRHLPCCALPHLGTASRQRTPQISSIAKGTSAQVTRAHTDQHRGKESRPPSEGR